jgi:hypothetical protein
MSIAVPTIFVSTNDLTSVQNSLNSLLFLQAANGMLPYAGIPFSLEENTISFTYHLYSLIGISFYYTYTGDVSYLTNVWDHFTRGIAWSLSFIDSSGLMNVNQPADWLRVGMGGHVSSSPQPPTRLTSSRILKRTPFSTIHCNRESNSQQFSKTQPPSPPGPQQLQESKQQPILCYGTPPPISTTTTKPQL